LHHLIAIEERINQILVHLEDLESAETDDDRASHPSHEVELEEKPSIDRGMTTISQLYLSALGLILDYQYETWYPSSRVQAWERPVPGSSCSSTSPSTPSPSKADHQVEMDLFTAAIHALEKTIYWRSIVLRQSRIDEPHHGSWAWSTSATGRSVDRGLAGMFLALPTEAGEEGDQIGEEIRGLEALPYLLEKTQAALVHVLTKDRQVRRQPGQGRADVPRRNGEEDVADLTPGEILRRAKYLTDLLNVFHRLPSKLLRMALSPPEQTEMDGKMVGLWIRLKAGVRRVEMLHDSGRVEESARKSGLHMGGYDPDGEETIDEDGRNTGKETTSKHSTEIEETFKRLLLQIERIPGEDLAPLLTRAQPWLPRTVTAGRERSFSSGSSSSSSPDQDDDSDNGSDSDEDESDTGKPSDTNSKRSRPAHPDPPNRPLLMRLLRMYDRYQEYRYALHLSQPVFDVVVKVESPKGKGKDMPPSGRNGSGKRKLSRFREDGELGAVWRRVMWGVSEIIGM
jgi:hypothetical protein